MLGRDVALRGALEVGPVRRYLVVANQTLGGEQLLAEIMQRAGTGPCHFYVLVPATPAEQLDPDYLASVRDITASASRGPGPGGDPDLMELRLQLEDEVDEVRVPRFTEEPGRVLARQRLRHELDRLRALDLGVGGEVGVADPVEAIRTVFHRYQFDEIILSTLPGRRSRWLALDLPSKVRRACKLPVTHVVGSSRPADVAGSG
jgi:hypothetical protein